MSLVDEIKEKIATLADGYHHALMHVAEAVDKVAGGGVAAADLEKLKAELVGELGPVIANSIQKIADGANAALGQLVERVATLEHAAANGAANAAAPVPLDPTRDGAVQEEAPAPVDAGQAAPVA